MGKQKDYQQVVEGEWWIQAWKNAKIACCDCGLVHNVNSKIVFGNTRNDMYLAQEVSRNDEETAKMRKAKGVKLTYKTKKTYK